MITSNLVEKAEEINRTKLGKFNKTYKGTKVGIMGGTFDPIHSAHLATAEFIRDKYKLDKIIFIPSGNPPHKKNTIVNKYDRYEMVKLATMSNENFIVSDMEIIREKRTYTIDTLRDMKKEYDSIDIYFITGADAICDIETWKSVEENFRLATFIAATRPGISKASTKEKINNLRKKYSANIIEVYVPSLDISSTYIRERLKNNGSIRYLVPEEVREYIEYKKLYNNGD